MHQPRHDRLDVAPPQSDVLDRQHRCRRTVGRGPENDGGGVGDEDALRHVGGAEGCGELEVTSLPLVLPLDRVVKGDELPSGRSGEIEIWGERDLDGTRSGEIERQHEERPALVSSATQIGYVARHPLLAM